MEGGAFAGQAGRPNVPVRLGLPSSDMVFSVRNVEAVLLPGAWTTLDGASVKLGTVTLAGRDDVGPRY